MRLWMGATSSFGLPVRIVNVSSDTSMIAMTAITVKSRRLPLHHPLPMLPCGMKRHLGPAIDRDLEVVLVRSKEYRIAVDVGGH